MDFFELSKRRGSEYDVMAETCVAITPAQFIDAFEKKEHAALFRDIGTYTLHTWIAPNALDIEYMSSMFCGIKTPVRLRLTIDRRARCIAFETRGGKQMATIHGTWTTRPMTDRMTRVTLRQRLVVHAVPSFVNVGFFLKRRVARAFEDLHTFASACKTQL